MLAEYQHNVCFVYVEHAATITIYIDTTWRLEGREAIPVHKRGEHLFKTTDPYFLPQFLSKHCWIMWSISTWWVLIIPTRSVTYSAIYARNSHVKRNSVFFLTIHSPRWVLVTPLTRLFLDLTRWFNQVTCNRLLLKLTVIKYWCTTSFMNQVFFL